MHAAVAAGVNPLVHRSCPRCGDPRIHRWGRFSGRQRYRCVACRRTFSTFTGTPLHYLKRLDAWPAFCEAVQRSLTLEESASHADIHRDTAFRWRHRFLAALAADERTVLEGPTSVGVMYFRYSRKGAPARPAPAFTKPDDLKRLPTGLSWVGMGIARGSVPGPWIPVAYARDAKGRSVSMVGTHPTEPHLSLLVDTLRDRIDARAVVYHWKGPFSAYARCARTLDLEYVRLNRSREEPPGLEQTAAVAARIRGWLRRFRGVATRYLPHYMAWFRALDVGWSPECWDLRRVGMGMPPG